MRAALRALPALLAALSAAVSALSDAELRSVAERLYAADRNRAAPAELRVNLQHRIDAASGAGNDYAPLPLFEHVDEALLRRSPFAELLALLDNYEALCGVEEEPTAEEQREEQRFLDAVLNTDVMEELLQSGLWGSRSALRAALQQLWFGRYSRSGGAALDSSGFEHVFVGEIKNGRVSGCHSWVQLLQLERSGRLDYLSYSYDGPWPHFPDVLALQFRWAGLLKRLGSTFLGSSPAFDMALYTLCHVTRPGGLCNVTLAGHAAAVQTYSWDGAGQHFIASAYPVSP